MVKILIVDDDPTCRLLSQSILERQGYEITVASSGEEAFELFKTERGKDDGGFKLVFTDMNMPRMTGVDLARMIHASERNQDDETPVILITGRLEGDFEGVQAVLPKPTSHKILITIVNALVN